MVIIIPKGTVHDTINTVLLIVFVLVVTTHDYLKLGSDNLILLIIFSASYLFGTFFLSPDLDLSSTPYKRWGFLRVMWWPYKELFKHRKMSHNIILGPVSIVGYFTMLIILFLWIVNSIHKVKDYHYVMYVVMITGFVISIELHIILDHITSKKNKRTYK